MVNTKGLFKLKAKLDDEVIFKTNTNNLDDLDDIFKTLKKKLRGN